MRFPPLSPLIRSCLALFLAAYIGLLIAVNWMGQGQLTHLLALSSELSIATLWQVFTYALVEDTSPSGLMSFFISAVFFWLIVSPFEQMFGTKRALQALGASLLGGALAALLVGLLQPGALFGYWTLSLGVFTAHAWVLHRLGQDANFFGALQLKPLTMIGLIFLMGFLGFLASGNWMQLGGNVGAIAAGILFTEWMSRQDPRKRAKRPKEQRKKRPADWKVVEGGRDKDHDKRWLN